MQRPAESKRLAILDLAWRGYRPARIAGEVEVSRQYVHAVLDRLQAALSRGDPERLHDLRSSYQQAHVTLPARSVISTSVRTKHEPQGEESAGGA